MGNRAVITSSPFNNNNIGIYVHWNGGRASVEGFLQACKDLGYRAPPDSYGWARLAQAIGNFFGGGLSVGIDICANLDCDNGDNGTYLISGWEIVGREFRHGHDETNAEKTAEIVAAIVARAPKEDA